MTTSLTCHSSITIPHHPSPPLTINSIHTAHLNSPSSFRLNFSIKQSKKRRTTTIHDTMGGCFSGDRDRDDFSSAGAGTAKVITINGELRNYRVPVTVAQVLRSESFSSLSSSQFVCNSDRLYYDEFIPALDSEEDLADGQIYFVLPRSKLWQRLTASGMAALAVKASVAMQKAPEKGGRRRRRNSRISPALQASREGGASDFVPHDAKQQQQPRRIGIEREGVQVDVKMMNRSGGTRRLRKYPSRRLKKAVRSFRIRLSTIHEGAVDVDVEF